jgi:cytochrome P450
MVGSSTRSTDGPGDRDAPARTGGEAMTTTDVYYDPYDRAIDADPYPVYARLRDEAPLYYNEPHDFYAVSRFEDVQRGLLDRETFSSARGSVLEFIKANIEMPPGLVIFEDPPLHDIHRGLLSRVFTPKKMLALEDKVREFCGRVLDPLVGAGRLDFVADLGEQIPMRTIGMLLGVPEADQEEARDRANASLRTDPGQPMEVTADNLGHADFFSDYIDWRATHPSDDLMTELLYVEFEDENGARRRLTRDEVLIYVSVVSGAGNETTNRLIGWMGKVVEDRSLVANAIEELLRFEPPTPHVARYVARDVELYDRTVPAGSALICLTGSANRDGEKYEDPDRFDVQRDIRQHLTFGYGIHFCLGAALARLEGRVTLDEVLTRFPEWEVDPENMRRAPTSTVRGWESMPVFTS